MLDPAAIDALAQSERRIVVVGAGGWIGLAMLELLADALGKNFQRRVCCFGSNSRVLELRGGLRVEQRALAEIADLPPMPTWVFHFAFLTKDRAEDMAEDDYRAANRAIDMAVLGALDPIGAEAIFVASSGAATKATDAQASHAMRLYGSLKLAEENLFAGWADDRGKRAVIARIFNITGPYINKHQSYALANFILDGLAGRPIVVKAPRAVIRSYVAIRELISLGVMLLSTGQGVARFDSGGVPLELADVAAAVADFFPRSKVERAPIVEPDGDIYRGDGEGYSALLTSTGIRPVSLAEQLTETIAYMRALPLGAEH